MTQKVAKKTMTMQEKFERLEVRIIRILTIGLSAIGLVVTIEGGIMLYVLGKQEKSKDEQTALKSNVKDFKKDFGQFLLISPIDHRASNQFIWDGLIETYNPKSQ